MATYSVSAITMTYSLSPSSREETPTPFRLGDSPIEVDEVLDRWLAPDHRYFKVRTVEGIYILRNDVTSGGWELTPGVPPA